MRSAARVLSQRRDIGFLAFTPDGFNKDISVSDDDVQTYFRENEAQFMTPQTVDAEVVELSWRDLLDDPSISVDEEALLAAYEKEKQDASGDEQRDSSHILLQINDDRDAATALLQIGELRARLEAGEDFGELAQEASEDPGSKSRAGSLGFVGKGVFDPAFEQALWDLEAPGDLSEPVRSAFGYHLIRLDGVRQRELPDFAARREALEVELKEEQARLLFAERLPEMDELAFEQAGSLEGVATALGVDVRQVAGVSASAGDDVFANAELRDALFQDEVLSQGFNSPAVRVGDEQAYVVRAATVHEPQLKELSAVTEEIRQTLVAQRAEAAAATAFAAALSRIESGEAVLDVAEDYGLTWQAHARQDRGSRVAAPDVIRTAFELPPPASGDKSVGSVDLGVSQGSVIVTVTAVARRRLRGDDRCGTGWSATLSRTARRAARFHGRVCNL